MRKSRFTDSQIMAVLKRAEGGEAVPELRREVGMSSATFYKWRAKFGGMDVSMMARMKVSVGTQNSPVGEIWIPLDRKSWRTRTGA